MLTLDLTNATAALVATDFDALCDRIPEVHARIESGSDPRPGSAYLGWRHLPETLDPAEFARQIDCAARLREVAPRCVVAGIGGSYLGAKATIDALGSDQTIRFAGHHVDPEAVAELLAEIDDGDFTVVVLSKSGTTTETAVAFRLLRELLVRRHGARKAAERIVAITDPEGGALRRLAGAEGYESFAIPPDVGGRFSVLTPVGLLPIAIAGIDIDGLVAGAAAVMRQAAPSPDYAPYRYAAARTALHQAGKRIEVLATQSVRLAGVGEWWKQLFGESEGKEASGLFPASVQYTTDLHSLGQWLQEGPREVIETFLAVESPVADPAIPAGGDDGDGLTYLAGRPLSEVNQAALAATRFAHLTGGIPNMLIRAGRRDAPHLGALYAFFERAVAMSGYLLGVDPFTQPGVEQYKQAMFALLGKPGTRFAAAGQWQQYQERPTVALEVAVDTAAPARR